MKLAKALKLALVGLTLAFAILLTASSSLSKSGSAEGANAPPETNQYKAEDYVGAETCKGCHEDQFNGFSKTTHFKLTQMAGRAPDKQGCESCHGPGKAHVEGGDKTKIRTFQGESAKSISEACLRCHAGKEEHNQYRRGEHWRNDVGCTDCHAPHHAPSGLQKMESATLKAIAANLTPQSEVKMLRNNQPALCLQCHAEIKGQFTQPFHHRVLEGTMKCSDCHNPHGGFEQKQTRLAIGADAPCLKCHTDKQGPFVYEHAPLKVEGCAACHSPHGSSNPKMLKRSQVSQLCLECHSSIGQFGAPNTPSFHNLATGRFQDCVICHSKIHGSQTHPFFFR
ncbi:MAG TPA: DmsE family decaheme c-type cytochrome [Blastocatellia bacterium]|nr:DmsE family decaheme c-type cytochrome [Blastocatellia bacterium]